MDKSFRERQQEIKQITHARWICKNVGPSRDQRRATEAKMIKEATRQRGANKRAEERRQIREMKRIANTVI